MAERSSTQQQTQPCHDRQCVRRKRFGVIKSVSTRPATDHDASHLAKVHLDTVVTAHAGMFPARAPTPTLEMLVNEWRAAFDDPTHQAFLATEHGSAIGTVAIRADPDNVGHGELRRLYVVPTHWAQGVGSDLHDTALQALRAAGCRATRRPACGCWRRTPGPDSFTSVAAGRSYPTRSWRGQASTPPRSGTNAALGRAKPAALRGGHAPGEGIVVLGHLTCWGSGGEGLSTRPPANARRVRRGSTPWATWPGVSIQFRPIR
jgi:GNAT superfamily N-acetyltransferase